MLLDAKFVLKIADFGFAAPFITDDHFLELNTRSGTKGYRAPEIFLASKNKNKKYCADKADIFALGVTLFNTFTGYKKPFGAAKKPDPRWKKFCEVIKSGVRSTKDESSFWERKSLEKYKFSANLQILLEKMMHPTPEERPNLQAIQVLFPWYCGEEYYGDQLPIHMASHKKTIEERKNIKKIQFW